MLIGAAPSCWVSICFDYNLDNQTDIYVGTYSTGANLLFENLGGGAFAEVGASAGVNFGYATHGVSAGDYNNDGWPDLYLGGYSSQRCRLYRNNQDGTFSDATMETGLLGYDDTRTVSFVDYDNDGWLDIFASHHNFYSYSNVMWHNQGDGTFVDVGAALGLSGEFIGDYFGVGWADYNNDGAVDLFAAGHIDKYRLFRNDNCPGNYLNLDLKGTISDSDALGASAWVHAGSELFLRQVVPGSGRQDGHGLLLNFGLGSHSLIDSLVVLWPSGLRQKTGALAVNQSLTLVETDMSAVDESEPDLLTENDCLTALQLHCQPNLLTQSTTIGFRTPAGAGEFDLSVYDLQGRRLVTLWAGPSTGMWQEFSWDGRTNTGNRSSQGVYFVKLTGGQESLIRKLIVL